MPFAALTGYDDLVREREHVAEPRREPGEEDLARISREIAILRRRDQVRVTHYHAGAYVTDVGPVVDINEPFHQIRVGRRLIRFEDVWHVERVDDA